MTEPAGGTKTAGAKIKVRVLGTGQIAGGTVKLKETRPGGSSVANARLPGGAGGGEGFVVAGRIIDSGAIPLIHVPDS